MFGLHGGKGFGGRTIIEFELRSGATVADLADEVQRRGLDSEGGAQLLFCGRPSWTDDMAVWLNESRAAHGREPFSTAKAVGIVDPTHPDFFGHSYLPMLAHFMRDRGFAALRLTDETVILDQSVIVGARQLTRKEIEKLVATPRLAPAISHGSLFTRDCERATANNPPVFEIEDLINTARAGIQKAVQEHPGRLTHGNTGQNGFVITGGNRICVYNDYAKCWKGSGGICVHSHSGDNWRGSVPENVAAIQKYMDNKVWNEEPERKQPLNSSDIDAFVKLLRAGDLSATVMIYYDGVMEIVAPSAKGTPEQHAALMRLKPRHIREALDVPYAEASLAWDKSKIVTEELDRRKLRQFAKNYGLLYLEGLRWDRA